jgi:hypothetical protein
MTPFTLKSNSLYNKDLFNKNSNKDTNINTTHDESYSTGINSKNPLFSNLAK